MSNAHRACLFFAAVLAVFAPASAEIAHAAATGMQDRLDRGYMLYVPEDHSPQTRILVCLPGWGIGAKQDINNWAFAAGKKGFMVIGIDVDYASISSTDDLRVFYSRLAGIVQHVAREYQVDPDSPCIAGTSAGGMMAIALALHFPRAFGAVGVVSGASLSFGADGYLNNAYAGKFFIIHGEDDERISLRESEATREALKNNGASVQYIKVPGGKHTLNSNAYKQVVDFLE